MRLLIAEDHQLLREGLRSLLEGDPELEIVGEATTGIEAVELAVRLRADLVLMDLRLPELDGIKATSAILRKRPETRVLVVSMHDDAFSVEHALRAGARGYLVKEAGISSLRTAIRAVSRGEIYLSPGIAGHVIRGYLCPARRANEQLTDREVQVLELICRGHTSREIAEVLELSRKTVENHRAHIMQKLDLHTTAALVRYAIDHGLGK